MTETDSTFDILELGNRAALLIGLQNRNVSPIRGSLLTLIGQTGEEFAAAAIRRWRGADAR